MEEIFRGRAVPSRQITAPAGRHRACVREPRRSAADAFPRLHQRRPGHRPTTAMWPLGAFIVVAIAVLGGLAYWDEQREFQAALDDFADGQAVLASSLAAELSTEAHDGSPRRAAPRARAARAGRPRRAPRWLFWVRRPRRARVSSERRYRARGRRRGCRPRRHTRWARRGSVRRSRDAPRRTDAPRAPGRFSHPPADAGRRGVPHERRAPRRERAPRRRAALRLDVGVARSRPSLHAWPLAAPRRRRSRAGRLPARSAAGASPTSAAPSGSEIASCAPRRGSR